MNKLKKAPIIMGKLLNIGGMLQRHGNRILMAFDLNQQQFSILFEIVKAEKVKQKEMVNRLMLEKAHVSKVVKKLYKLELITIAETDEDRRSYWLLATSKGKKVVSRCMKIFEEWNREWTDTIDEEQLNLIVEHLNILQTTFKHLIHEKE